MSKNIYERQSPQVALVDITIDTIANGFTVGLPRGTYLLDTKGTVATAFDTGGTTPVITLKLNDGSADLISTESLASTGDITVDTTSKFYADGATLTGTLAQSAASGLVAATVGQAVLAINYVQLGRGGTVQDT